MHIEPHFSDQEVMLQMVRTQVEPTFGSENETLSSEDQMLAETPVSFPFNQIDDAKLVKEGGDEDDGPCEDGGIMLLASRARAPPTFFAYRRNQRMLVLAEDHLMEAFNGISEKERESCYVNAQLPASLGTTSSAFYTVTVQALRDDDGHYSCEINNSDATEVVGPPGPSSHLSHLNPCMGNHWPLPPLVYPPGTWLSVIEGTAWRDVQVVESPDPDQLTSRAGSAHAVQSSDQQAPQPHLVDLNEFNSAVRLLPQTQFEAAHQQYLDHIKEENGLVEDAITGAKVSVVRWRRGSVGRWDGDGGTVGRWDGETVRRRDGGRWGGGWLSVSTQTSTRPTILSHVTPT